jgi:hypothetical protein
MSKVPFSNADSSALWSFGLSVWLEPSNTGYLAFEPGAGILQRQNR